jgi:hypothetical protein
MSEAHAQNRCENICFATALATTMLQRTMKSLTQKQQKHYDVKNHTVLSVIHRVPNLWFQHSIMDDAKHHIMYTAEGN